MKRWQVGGLLFGLLLSNSLGAGGSAQLSAPTATAKLARGSSAEASPSGGIPAWSNGSFLAFDGNHGGAPVLQVFDRGGQPLLLTTVAIPEATRVNLIVAARSPQGALAVSGTAQDSQGAGANFIAWITTSGVISRVVRTTPFAAMDLAFAPDGTLWALGRELQHNATRPVATTMLRQYGTTCELLRTALPSETFVSQHPHPVVDALLAVSSDRVGVLSVMASQWAEVAFSGAVLGSWTLSPFPSNSRVTGLAMTSKGTYVTVQPPAQTSVGHGEVYKLDKAIPAWLPVDPSNVFDGRSSGVIIGNDGDNLVIWTGGASVAWTRE
jgi:hypothetical protein